MNDGGGMVTGHCDQHPDLPPCAKDRLYLYCSFRREDLSDNDLRGRLLDHFAAPLHLDPERKGRERYESDFERAVFDRLAAKGYRVTPQVPAAGYRIDLVIEGHSGRRLAVECDGDQYHTPDDWLHDLQRQRTRERVGWTFWRCWGSSFLRDPDGCMAELFNLLGSRGIEPIGALEMDLSDVVQYREVGQITSVQDSAPKAAQADLDTASISLISQPTSTKKLDTCLRSPPSRSGLNPETPLATVSSMLRMKMPL
jgi:very-short-patch-repair endonuclease